MRLVLLGTIVLVVHSSQKDLDKRRNDTESQRVNRNRDGCCRAVVKEILKVVPDQEVHLAGICEGEAKLRATEFAQTESLTPVVAQFVKDLESNIYNAYPRTDEYSAVANALTVGGAFASNIVTHHITRSTAAQDEIDQFLSREHYDPESAEGLAEGIAMFQLTGCSSSAQEAAEHCDFVPDFARGYNYTSLAARTRMRQASLGAMIRIIIDHSGLGFWRRYKVFYLVYTALSGTGAGVYYPKDAGADADPHYLFQHALDIGQRCWGPSCAFAAGRAFENRIGVFRTWNALESSLLYSCFAPTKICPRWFTPIPFPLTTLTDADYWAMHYGFAREDFGEAVWVPHSSSVWCAAEEMFVPNDASRASY